MRHVEESRFLTRVERFVRRFSIPLVITAIPALFPKLLSSLSFIIPGTLLLLLFCIWNFVMEGRRDKGIDNALRLLPHGRAALSQVSKSLFTIDPKNNWSIQLLEFEPKRDTEFHYLKRIAVSSGDGLSPQNSSSRPCIENTYFTEILRSNLGGTSFTVSTFPITLPISEASHQDYIQILEGSVILSQSRLSDSARAIQNLSSYTYHSAAYGFTMDNDTHSSNEAEQKSFVLLVETLTSSGVSFPFNLSNLDSPWLKRYLCAVAASAKVSISYSSVSL